MSQNGTNPASTRGFTRDKTILCVDDNENGLRIRKIMLEAFGFAAEIVTSGRSALELLEARRFDAVVLDYNMPEMDGAELADAIKQSHPELPMVMLTGYPHEIPARTLSLVDAMLVKGDRPERLLATLLAVTGSTVKRPVSSVREVLDRNSRHVSSVNSYLKKPPRG